MTLSIRPTPYSLPSYSLTGDLLSYKRCGLQYRYNNIGRLPTSQPLQLWFGEFIHGVLEETFRRYNDHKRRKSALPPWSADEIEEIRALIKERLKARGIAARDEKMEALADERATTVINELGPILLPLIHRAEVRLYGARALPKLRVEHKSRQADRYEISGVVDVVSHITLHSPVFTQNPIVRLLTDALPGKDSKVYEVIIDYKGMRRPPNVQQEGGSLWEQYEWQVQTYAELRRKQQDAEPVIAGVLLYVNELHPSSTDMDALKQEVRGRKTDVLPEPGSADEKAILSWTGGKVPELSFEYRLRRALRLIVVSEASIKKALTAFDQVVEQIESCRNREAGGMSILSAWPQTGDENTCTACDSRTFCTKYRKELGKKNSELQPRLPGVGA